MNSFEDNSIVSRLVRPEDLNHHGTLFAGRMALWFVEAAFIEASRAYGDPSKIVCLKIHGMRFILPVQNGDIVEIRSKLAHVGKTSLSTYVKIYKKKTREEIVDGFVTFVIVDEEGKPVPHKIKFNKPTDKEGLWLWEEVEKLRKL